MLRVLAALALTAACVWAGSPPQPVPEFSIDLDAPPAERFTEVVNHFKPALDKLYKGLVDNLIVKTLAKKLAQHRGPENPELMAEINGIASTVGWPVYIVQSAQVLYELQTLMVPITNITLPFLSGAESEALTSLLDRSSPSSLGFGCTGIIARDETDGTVYHARNLDFSFAKYLQNMTYNAHFTRAGKLVYTAQMIAVYQSILTGIRPGSNGYSFEVNTRYYGHKGGNKEMFKNLFVEKRPGSGWVKRQILQNYSEYEDAVHQMSTHPYAATEYNIISGVKKGTILARDPDNLVYSIDLGASDRYIIMTNFDYIYHDIKEWFDPTSIHGIGHSRRIGAEKLLNSTDTITPDVLFSTLNSDDVMAKDTIFQAIINVEKNIYNTSLPNCVSCH